MGATAGCKRTLKTHSFAQGGVDARLPALSAGAEMVDDVTVEPKRNMPLGRPLLRTTEMADQRQDFGCGFADRTKLRELSFS
jgi:hypothetical protein